jgi:hypothetical protein
VSNHPRLLAFELTVQPDEPYEDHDPTYPTTTAANLAELRRLVSPLTDWTILAVHHISDEDAFTITDILWDFKSSLDPYDDRIAELSFELLGLR